MQTLTKVIWADHPTTSQSKLQNKEYYQAKRTFYMIKRSVDQEDFKNPKCVCIQ